MSSRTAAGRKRLQAPHPKVPPFNEHSVNQPKTFASAELIPLPPLVHAIPVQQPPRLDLSNEFSPSLPSLRFPQPQSNQAAQAVSTYGASSPCEDIPQFRRPLLRVNPHAMAYQTPSEPPFQSPIPKPASPAKTPLPYVPSLPFPPSHPPPSPTKYSGHPAASYYPSLSQPSSRRPNRHSPTSSELPEYRSMYSSYEENHIAQSYLPQVGTKNLESWGYNQYYQYPPGSRSGPPPLPPVSLSPIKSESRFPYRASPGPQTSLNPSPTSHVQEPPGSSASSSSLSGSGTSASSSGGRRPPPPPPPSPNFVFPGSRSIARPKVSSKITKSQVILISKSTSHPGKDLQENSHTIDISSDAQAAFDTAPESPVQSNNAEVSPEEDSFRLSDDYKRKIAPKVPETLVFPTGRSRAHPKLSSGSRSSKNSNHSSLNRDVNQPGGRSRFIEALFKKKKKVKVPNITPVANSIASGSVASFEPSTSEQAVSTGSSDSTYELNGHRERTRRTKPKSGSYPLDPYNSVLLDNDRYTGELLSRLNPTGSPSFHDYGDNPPSSVLDLGCGQGHWVLEAAVTWKEYNTHVTGYDMVDISRNLLPWATEQGVRDNIRFVKGNFLKQQLPFESNTFDLVRMSCLSLCITSDYWGFILQEVCRVLMTGGRLELIDDQIFFPYGRVSSTMNDTGSIIGSVASRLDSVLSPAVTTFSIYGDAVDNPGLGSTTGHLSSDDDAFDLEHEFTSPHGQRSRVRPEMLTFQPRASPTLMPEAWDRALDISEDLEALFEHMLLDDFDIHKDPSDFILPLMIRVFGQAREGRTMNLVLAPPDTIAQAEYFTSQRQQGLSHCPGLVLWPSTFIPMDHTEVEIHASKHLRTLLSCKTFLTQHAMEISDDERVDEEFISEALWEYENFLQHRFNPPAPYRDDSLKEESDTSSILSSIAESTTSDSREAMLEIQSDLRQRFAWLPERDAPSNTTSVTTPSPPISPVSPISSRSAGDNRYLRSSFSSSEAPPAPSNEITHVRTFRVYEAIKLDNYVLTYDAY